MQLFRQQAIDHQHRLYGEVLLVPPLRWRAIVGLLLLLIVTAALFLTLGTYRPTVRASGMSHAGGRIDLVMPASLAAQIMAGQDVRLTLASASSETDAVLRGKVAKVATALKQGGQSPSLVTVQLVPWPDRQPTHDTILSPGMAVDARIALAPRSLMQWIVDPDPGAARR